MIVGHHAGAQLLVTAVAGGTTFGGVLLVVLRANLDRVVRWLSRR